MPLFDDEDYYLKKYSHGGHELEFFDASKLNGEASYALSLNHFNLIVDTFLRGQLLSLYLSSRNKNSMSFW